jgi:hypothetical protein
MHRNERCHLLSRTVEDVAILDERLLNDFCLGLRPFADLHHPLFSLFVCEFNAGTVSTGSKRTEEGQEDALDGEGEAC